MIMPIAEINLVPLMDKEKQKKLRKYLKSIRQKIKLGAPPQVPAYPEVMNFWENQFGILDTPRQLVKTPAERAIQGKDIIHWTGLDIDQSVEVNVGIEDQPKIVKIGAALSPQERQ
ncbi:hypothetical protein R1flu_008695 [Riccia fluitans]|uniref:Uncharacterized protein n=1 Tax=Riccia fluitans TaxID=41844 RepID=A0ABD1YCN0_9MARC